MYKHLYSFSTQVPASRLSHQPPGSAVHLYWFHGYQVGPCIRDMEATVSFKVRTIEFVVLRVLRNQQDVGNLSTGLLSNVKHSSCEIWIWLGKREVPSGDRTCFLSVWSGFDSGLVTYVTWDLIVVLGSHPSLKVILRMLWPLTWIEVLNLVENIKMEKWRN